MENATITPEERANRITRRNLLSSLLIGVALGTFIIGLPLGWFLHQVYARQHAAQVLLCRQRNFGLTESELEGRCGNLY